VKDETMVKDDLTTHKQGSAKSRRDPAYLFEILEWQAGVGTKAGFAPKRPLGQIQRDIKEDALRFLAE